jgi:hypothetical protein
MRRSAPRGGDHAESRATREQCGDARRGVEDLLEIVEQEQHPLFDDVLGQAVARSDRLGDRRFEQLGSVTDASGTQKTPSSNSPTSSAAT